VRKHQFAQTPPGRENSVLLSRVGCQANKIAFSAPERVKITRRSRGINRPTRQFMGRASSAVQALAASSINNAAPKLLLSRASRRLDVQINPKPFGLSYRIPCNAGAAMGQVAGKLPPRRGPKSFLSRPRPIRRHRAKTVMVQTCLDRTKGTLESREPAFRFFSRDRRSCPASPR